MTWRNPPPSEEKKIMAIPGETTGGAALGECSECEMSMPLKVCFSPAGYFLGYWCDGCGPAGRETGYFGSKQEAEDALESFFADGILQKKR